ncbi:rho guanine nucleotide exchange factor 11 isoform X2 [Salmo salar]|uniref:Rho guanine nucleotide exchange factor 11 isoform X2 n=1 Tax=Salmo salar TaxID=8030 RepID=A0A1S3N8B7_SALSA|nr:rho guanine nucleotide exchange factor 11 isoform X2 [Salmo salar]XP_045556410.1 rho guanine nucleotide exchange factor 11 isoform X2 [Salmo salar]
MSLRTPTSTLDRLSSLTIGDSERNTSSGLQREPLADIPPENTGPGLVQRCVVVQKDQLGFGFTVCGERIKLVQNVRPGGAAVKAGVHEGDRIIKVNGSLVSSMSHQEVVKLIKSGPYVALTLQGPPPSAAALVLQPLPADLLPNQRTSLGGEAPPPPPPPLPPGLTSTPSQRINKPLQNLDVQKHATQILRNMLEQGEAELQDLMEELSRNPSPSLEERIESAKRRTQQVRVKIKQDLDGTRPEAVSNYVIAGDARLSVDSSEGDFETCESPHSSPSFFRTPLRWRQGSDTHTFSDSAGKTQIIGPEEEEEEDDSYALNEMDGPFQDVELLKSRPAHMTVFMRYVFSQLLDPNPLLFYLSVEAYLGSSPKDARALAPQICSHFLDPDAPLKIRVREEYLTDIESRLHAQEDIRGPLSELQQQVLPDIQDQIQDYRNKQMMGLGSLFGEGDLQQLDGDPAKEKQVVDRQVTALWEILSKHEDDRSSPLASAVLLYLRHSGIKLRDSRVFPGLSTEKEKWLAFFPKTKKLSSAKKEKDGEDRKRNPILKYIGKPRSTSQSTFHVPLSPTEVRPGSVRNIIQQFENHPEIPGEEGAEGDLQRLSSSSLGEDSMDSPMVSVRLARSESLKAQGEGRRRGGASGVETVPRSRSDVDIEDCGEEIDGPGLRPLHHSAASSATSSSARSLENPTPPYTPRSSRRQFEESPVALLPDAPALEDDVVDSHNWQETVAPQVLASLCPREVDRQAVIYELLTTEASHLRTLRVLDQVFFQKMRCVLSSDELACIFPNLPQVYQLHVSLCEAMKKKRESPIVRGIGDIMLARFEGVAGEEFQEQASQLCSQQSQALELIKNKQRKDLRFTHIIQECEASPHCRRLQLKDLLVSETQRLTKYPLLLDNIIKHTEAGSTDLPPLQRAQACCRGILQAVNEVVRETEHRQRLHQYQRRLDPTPQFKSLDLTSKTMIHEGPLTWKVNKDKTLEIQALLLSDLLVLLQRGPDDRLLLRCPSRWLGGGGGGSGDTKASFSPVVQLDSLLVRSVATDNKALYVISTTERKIYELVAGTSSEKNIWKDQLEKTISLVAGSSPSTNNRSTPIFSPSLGNASPVSTGSHVYQSGDSMTEQVVFMETDSPNDEDNELAPTTPTDQSGAFLCGEGRDYVKRRIGLAEAALEDVETLRQLIFRDLEEDGWSHGSDGTPTNEAANERSPFNDQQRLPSSETLLSVSPSQWEAEHAEAPPSEVESPCVHVVRKAVVAGSPSIPDDITEDVTLHSDQSPEPRGEASVRGNVFYLVMPTGQGEGLLDESHTDEVNHPPTPTTTELPDLEQEVMSSPVQTHEKEGQVASIMSADNQSERENLSWEEGRSRSQKSLQSHVIKNVDDIFHTIEELMRKLHQLRDIETAHHQLLKTLREPPVNPESGDLFRIQATVVRTPFLDRDPGDGKEASPAEPAKLKILSTGF